MSTEYDPDLDLEEDVPEEDEPEDEEEPEDEPPEDEEPGDQDDEPPPLAARTRGENRVAQATRRAAEERRRADALAAELATHKAQLEAAQRAAQQPQETPQQLRERLSLMDPVDAAQYLIDQNERRLQGQLAQIRWEAQESADKTSFEAFCSRNPVAAKLKDQVEQRLATMRAAGTTVSREVLLTHMLGERQLANSNRANGRAQRQAATNRERQAARPANSRGDTAPEGRTGNAAAQRNKRMASYEL